MNFHIITIFPEIFNSYFNESILARAQKENIIKINIYNLRDYTDDKHKTVDDTPYGGGAGMILKIEPLVRAISDIKNKILDNKKSKTILFSAKGNTWQQKKACTYSKLLDLILICGRYEGVDERILEFIDEEVSIGDYVLTGGEIPAMAMVDSIARLLPGCLGNEISAQDESHTELGVLEYPQYTRPEIFEINNHKYQVPSILLSGNHAEIQKWRKANKRKK